MDKYNKRASALAAEMIWLEGDAYEENGFLISAFIGQIQRVTNKEKSTTKKKKRRQ